MRHTALPRFWDCYNSLPANIRAAADKNCKLLKADPTHPSLHFKKLGGRDGIWSVRIGTSYRALGRETDQGVAWFWIGSHSDYDKILG